MFYLFIFSYKFTAKFRGTGVNCLHFNGNVFSLTTPKTKVYNDPNSFSIRIKLLDQMKIPFTDPAYPDYYYLKLECRLAKKSPNNDCK